MPIIPLIQNRPLGDAAAPVLDRERRPTVDNSAIAAAAGRLGQAGRMPTINADAFAAPYEALGSVGRAVAQAGNVVGALAIKMQEARTDTQIAEFDSQAGIETAKFEQWKLETNADPATWGAEFAKRANAFQERTNQRKDLTPGARIALEPRMIRWQGQTTAAVTAGAAKETFARARAGYEGVILQAAEDQDPERFSQAQADGLAKGYFYKDDAVRQNEFYKRTGERKQREAESSAIENAKNAAAKRVIEKGETEALKALDSGEFGELEPMAAESVRSVVKSIGNSRAAEFSGSVLEGIYNGGVKNPADIEASAVGNPAATPAMVAEMKRDFFRRNDQDQQMADELDRRMNGDKNFADLYVRVNDFERGDFKNDAEAQLAAHKLRSEIKRKVGADDDGYLQKLLWEKQTSRPIEGRPTDATKTLVNERIADLFPKTSWTTPTKVKGKTEPVMIENPAKKREAQISVARVKNEMEKWMQANPKEANDPVKVDAAIQRLLPEGTRFRRLESMMRSARPAEMQTDDLGLPPVDWVPVSKPR